MFFNDESKGNCHETIVKIMTFVDFYPFGLSYEGGLSFGDISDD